MLDAAVPNSSSAERKTCACAGEQSHVPQCALLGGFVRLGLAKQALAALSQIGADPAVVLRDLGIDIRLFEDPGTQISLRALGSLMRVCSEHAAANILVSRSAEASVSNSLVNWATVYVQATALGRRSAASSRTRAAATAQSLRSRSSLTSRCCVSGRMTPGQKQLRSSGKLSQRGNARTPGPLRPGLGPFRGATPAPRAGAIGRLSRILPGSGPV